MEKRHLFNKISLPVIISLCFCGGTSLAQQEVIDISQILSGCKVDFDKTFATKIYKNGLVLYGDEYDTAWTKNYPAAAEESSMKFVEINKIFLRNKIKMIVLPIPSRSSMLPPWLMNSTGIDVASIDKSYRALVSELKSKQIETVDALQPFKSSFDQEESRAFLTEAHWTEDGAFGVAQLVAPLLENGQLNMFSEALPEIRAFGSQPINRYALSSCGITLPDEYFKDYKMYSDPHDYFVSGFSDIEVNKRVWSLGEKSTLSFYSDGGMGKINLGFFNPIKNQQLTIRLNGKVIHTVNDLDIGDHTLGLNIEFAKGRNKVEINPKRTNRDKFRFAQDNRALSLYFEKLEIQNPNINFMEGLKSETSNGQDGLFDDTVNTNILLGTSYSEETNENNLKFADFLRLISHEDILNFSRGAGGLTSAIRDFIESPQFGDGKPHNLVWEFPFTLIRESSEDLNQIINALKFNSCTKSELYDLSSDNNIILFPREEGIIKLSFKDQSVSSLLLSDDKFELKLTNNKRQESKNIFYFDRSLFGPTIKIEPEINSEFSARLCKI